MAYLDQLHMYNKCKELCEEPHKMSDKGYNMAS